MGQEGSMKEPLLGSCRSEGEEEEEEEETEQDFEGAVHISRSHVSFMQSVWLATTSPEFMSLVVLTLHMSTLPLLVRQASKPVMVTENTTTPVRFLSTTSVLVSEFFKLIICTILIASVMDKPLTVFKRVYTTIVQQRRETAKVCVPALVYAIQNNLYYVALANLDASTFSVTSQLRILTTAVLAVLMLKQILSRAQWGALFLSLIGVIIVQLEKAAAMNSSSTGASLGSPAIGFASTFAIAWMSAFAGVYFEKVLKESKTDVWIQNIRLALLTIPFSALTMFASDGRRIFEGGFFQGWTPLVWLVTVLTALGGLLVSLVMKYADNVRKTYCQTVAIAITVLISAWTGDLRITIELLGGIAITIASVIIYMMYPHQSKVRPALKPPVIVIDSYDTDGSPSLDKPS